MHNIINHNGLQFNDGGVGGVLAGCETFRDDEQEIVEDNAMKASDQLYNFHRVFCVSSQTMSRKNSDTNGANPMLYDPLQEGGIGETNKIRQFMAATVGK